MTDFIQKLTVPHVLSLTPYQSARRLYSGGQDWLNANESPFSFDYQVDSQKLNRYPSCQPENVINGYASYCQLKSDQVLVSRGADEGIELLIRAFCRPQKDNIVICTPTYGMYAISAKTFQVGVTEVPLTVDYELDVELVCAQDDVKVVFICSPNNPTGTDCPQHQIEKIIEHYADKALVVIDEAYIEFSDQSSWAHKLAQYPNLVVLRTLSKAFALAGLRCGFTLAHPNIIETLLKVIAPYPLSEPVAQIASQALSSASLDRVAGQISQLNEEREYMKGALSKVAQCELVGGDSANFLLYRVEQKNELMQHLVQNGMLIRDQSSQRTLNDCLRVSMGTREQSDRLLDLIQQFYNT